MTLVHTNRSRIDSFFHPRRLSQSPKEKGPRDAETVSLSSRHGNARGQEDRLHPVKRQRLEWQGGVEEEGEEEDEEEENGKANGKDEDEDKAITIDRDAAEPVLASTSLNGTVHPPNTTIGSGRPSMPLMQRTVSVQTEDSIVEGGTDDGDDSVDGAVTTTGPSQVRTDLEQALPDIEDETNQSSIAAYEAYKASQKTTEELHDGRGEGVAEPQLWRSSIYVDAFNLALDTVLADEAHLFNDVERRVFDEWKRLGYGAQYLFVSSISCPLPHDLSMHITRLRA